MLEMDFGRMDPLHLVVWGLLKIYQFFHYLVVKWYSSSLKIILTKKMSRIGLNVVECPGGFNDMIRKEEIHYEMSKRIGTKPTLTIYNPNFFDKLCEKRGMGFGESYLDGWWDCDQLDELSHLFFQHDLMRLMLYRPEKFANYLKQEFFNMQTVGKVADGHYDLGDTLFELFLDDSMTYSCAYWKNAEGLAEAQHHKLDLLARKLKLRPGMRVFDVGCGWGGLAQFLAEKYKVSVVGCNIAKDGARIAAERCKGLPVVILCCDYREVEGKFDRVVSVGFMEHVGPHNYEDSMKLVHRCLDDEGIFLIHTIGVDNDDYMRNDEFASAYIFPNGVLPRATEVTKALSGYFTLEDWHSFGSDYDKTLLAWYKNFVVAWPTIKHQFKDPT